MPTPKPPLRPADLFLDAARLHGHAVVPRVGRGAALPAAPASPARPASPERPAPPPGAEGALKRTYTLRRDQDRALGVALLRQTVGEDRAHGADRSEIVRALLDLHGYNARYLDGEPLR